MQKPSDVAVNANLIPIPDGVATSDDWGKPGRLKISLVIAPAAAGGAGVALNAWPAAVAGMLNDGLALVFSGAGAPVRVENAQIQVHPSVTLASADAGRMWRKLFRDDEFLELRDVIAEAWKPEGQVRMIGQTRAYSASGVAAYVGGMREAAMLASLSARLTSEAEWAKAGGASSARLARWQVALMASASAPFREQFATRLQGLLSARWPAWSGVGVVDQGKIAGRLSLRELSIGYNAAARAACLRRLKFVSANAETGLSPILRKAMQAKAAPGAALWEPRLLGMPAMRDLFVQWLLGEEPAGKDLAGPALTLSHDGARVESGDELVTAVATVVDAFHATFGPARSTPSRHQHALRKQVAQATLDAEEWRESLRTRYAGISAQPTLAKLLNFTVDIQIDPPAAAGNGYLQVAFGGAMSSRVAYHYESGVFRPATIAEMGVKNKEAAESQVFPLRGGVVQLDPGRFELVVTDVHVAANALVNQVTETRSAHLHGDAAGTVGGRLVEERGRGIQLVDKQPLDSLLASLVSAGDPDGADLYAENLTIGYRAFVRRWPAGGKPAKPWASLMARSRTYEGIDAEYKAGPGSIAGGEAWRPYREFPEREHAMLRPLPRVDKAEDGSDMPVAPSHVFAWVGDSLGVPPAHGEQHLTQEEHERELASQPIVVTYGYGDQGQRQYRLPILRVGDSYEVGLAPVYLHGGGPTLQEAGQAFDKGDGTLGRGRSFMFGPPNGVEGPVVLAPPDDPLARDKSGPGLGTLQRIVLRSGAGEDRDRVVRYLAPPRVDFSRAEQFGVFDQDDSLRPRGAFESYELVRSDGDFPGVHERGREGARNTVKVLRYRNEAVTPDQPYYPDPLARNLGFAFERGGKHAPGYPDQHPPLSFWNRSRAGFAACLDATPVQLEFGRWKAGREGGHVDRDDTIGRVFGPGSAVQNVPKLSIELAPAEEANLWIWCWPDLPELFRAQPRLQELAARALALTGNGPATRVAAALGANTAKLVEPSPGFLSPREGLEKAVEVLASAFRSLAENGQGWEPPALAAHKGAGDDAWTVLLEAVRTALFGKGPFNGVNGWCQLQLVHAVARPLRSPSIPVHGDSLAFAAFRLRRETPFDAYVAGFGPGSPLPASEEGGTDMYFGGLIGLDRASTGSLRVEASWPVLDYGLAVRKKRIRETGREIYVDDPPCADQILFEIRDIPREPGTNPPGQLDLLRDEKGQLRRLVSAAKPVGSAATAACHLNLRLVATSRFVHEFTPESGPAPAGEPGKFEAHTRSPVQSAGGKVVHEYVVTVKATVRPPPPVVTRTEMLAPEHRRLSGDRILVSKSFSLRLYLDSSIRVSGPDELIAVLIAPADSVKTREYEAGAEASAILPWDPADNLVPEFADDLARYPVEPEDAPLKDALHYATRWGADPAALPTGRLESLISPARFSGNVAAYPNQQLPVKSAIPGGLAPVKVGVLLYKPQLDPHSGEWYIDVGVDPGGAHAPFVRLALARYQPFALNDSLALSTPVLLDPVRIPAPRLVELSRGPHQKIQVKVVGAGYTRRAPAGASGQVRHLTDVALQNMALMRAVGNTRDEWLPVFDAQGQAQRNERVQPGVLGSLQCWVGSFEPPPGRGAERYAIVIDEVDMHLPDAFLDAQPPAAPKDALPADLVARPGFFSITVPLKDDHDG